VSGLEQLQRSFFGHLLGKSSDIVEHIQSTEDTSAQQRVDIYASGYRLRLKEAIMTDFEQLHAYMGDDWFEQLMDSYIDRYRSHHPSLRYYSQHMLELLDSEQPFSEVPVLREIADIEQAFNSSFDAADCTSIEVNQLAEVAAEDWPVMRLELHSSVLLLTVKYNSFPIWKALSEQQQPPELVAEPTVWVIWRKDLLSRYRALSDAEAMALGMVAAGADFGELCEGLLAFFDEQQTPQQAIVYLQTWIKEKMVCKLGA